MIWQIIEYSATIIEYLIYADFMVRFLNSKKPNYQPLIYVVIVLTNTFLTLTFNYFMNFEGMLGIVRITMNFAVSYILLKGTLFEKLFTAIILDITALLSSYMSLNLTGLLSGSSTDEMIETRGLIRILTIFIAKVVLFEVTRVILHMKGKTRFSFEFNETLVISIIFAITLIIGFGIFRENLNAGVASESPTALIIGIGLITINVFTYILMKRISDKNLEKEKLLLDKAQNELYFSQLNEYEKQFDEMHKIRHDIKNHLQCIAALIREGNDEKVMLYIDDIIENKLDFGYNHINTGNKVVDAVINMKLLQCKKDNIITVVHINKFDTYVEDTDMCALLSNILDNAIEASRKEIEHKEIQIEIMPKKAYVNILIKNAISSSVLEKNPELETTKSDITIHGVGMRAINEIVKKYDGMLDFYEHNHYFISDIWLPLKSSKVAN